MKYVVIFLPKGGFNLAYVLKGQTYLTHEAALQDAKIHAARDIRFNYYVIPLIHRISSEVVVKEEKEE